MFLIEQRKNDWIRPAAAAKQFPANKYQFSKHLVKVGDWVETNPLTQKEYYNIQDAVHAWAWVKKYRVKTESWPDGTGKKFVKITLISHKRNRDYEV